MPTYDYSCTQCNHEWEEFQNINDEHIKECPVCKEQSAKRLISVTNFVLVGGGWAKDNYSSK